MVSHPPLAPSTRQKTLHSFAPTAPTLMPPAPPTTRTPPARRAYPPPRPPPFERCLDGATHVAHCPGRRPDDRDRLPYLSGSRIRPWHRPHGKRRLYHSRRPNQP